MITNRDSGTRVDEIANGIHRVSTPVMIPGGAFTFNQYLIVVEEPLLFHVGPWEHFPLVREAVAGVLPSLRHISFSHVEADECGSLNEWLAAAPRAAHLCGTVAAMVAIEDLADRPPGALVDGEAISLGSQPRFLHRVP